MIEYIHAQLLVTTLCNRQCRDCCYRIPGHETLPPQHYDWPYFERAAEYLGNLNYLYVTGGEPTLHPQFVRIAAEFRVLFNPQRMVLATNGAGILQHIDSLDDFDEVRITNFGPPPTPETILQVTERYPNKIVVRPGTHYSLEKRGGGYPCERRYIPAYANGRLYPCCVAPGIPDAVSIEPTNDWKLQLAEVPLPCASCLWSTAP